MSKSAEHALGSRVRVRPHVGFVAAQLLFAAVLVTLILSAFHAPSPHQLPVGIVAPATVTGQVDDALGRAAPGGFDLRIYQSAAAARAGVTRREVDGAVIASPDGLRLLVARAGGAAPAQALITAFTAIAARSGKHLTVTDLAPPLPGDTMALSPFFIILGVLFPSLAAGSASALVFRRSRRAWKVAAPVVIAVVVGLAVAGIADGISGLGHYAAIAGIVALFALAVAAPTAALARIWPPLTAVAVLVFMVLSIPVSGGPSGLASFGPGFLRALHPALPLGEAASAVRGAVYFGGYGTAAPLWTLAAWAAAGLVALILVATLQRPSPALVTARPAGTGGQPAGSAGSAGAAGPEQVPLSPVSLVVGFDNSQPARRALSSAARLAADRQGTLHIVYADHVIIDSDLSGFAHAELEAARDREAAAVAQAAADLVTEADVKYTFERRQGGPADAILAVASDLASEPGGSDPVIVVGRSGHTAHHLLGSVPVRLLHHSPGPVLTIP